MDNLSFNFGKLNIKEVTSKISETVQDLPQHFESYEVSSLVRKAKQPKHLTLESVSNKPQPRSKSSQPLTTKSPQPSPKIVVSDLQPSSPSIDSPISSDTYIPLRQRVQMRLQTRSDKEHLTQNGALFESPCSSKTKETGDINSLINEVENLSLRKVPQNDLKSTPGIHTKFPMHFTPVITPKSLASPLISDLNGSTSKQKTSSPAFQHFCSPGTFMKQSDIGNQSFEIQNVTGQTPMQTTSCLPRTLYDLDQLSGESERKHGSEVDSNPTMAKKLIDRLEKGIMNVGKEKPPSPPPQKFSFFDGDNPYVRVTKEKPKTNVPESKPSTPLIAPKLASNNVTQNVGQSPLNLTALGLDPNQFGDFNMQTSLLNSLCSSLMQALTPKGISLSKEEYTKLLTSLDEADSGESAVKTIPKTELESTCHDDDDDVDAKDELACNIDFSDIEKASTQLKKMNQGLVLDPIRLVGEAHEIADIEYKSKSARKKLRRKEKKKALEDIAHLNNVSQGQNVASVEKKVERHLPERNTPTLSPKKTIPNSKGTDIYGETKIERIKDTKLRTPELVNILQKKKKGKKTDSGTAANDIKMSPSYSPSKQSSSRKESFKGEIRKQDKQQLSPFTVSKSPCSATSPRNEYARQMKSASISKETCRNIFNVSDTSAISDSINSVLNNMSNDSETTENAKKKKKKKKKVKKASPLINLSVDESMNSSVCESYLKMALEKSREKVVKQASTIFDISTDDSLLELENISSKVVGEELDVKQVNKIALMRKVKQLSLEKSKLAQDGTKPNYLDATPSFHDERRQSDSETVHNKADTSESDDSDTGDNNNECAVSEIIEDNLSILPKFEIILEPCDGGGASDRDDVKHHENDNGYDCLMSELVNTKGVQSVDVIEIMSDVEDKITEPVMENENESMCSYENELKQGTMKGFAVDVKNISNAGNNEIVSSENTSTGKSECKTADEGIYDKDVGNLTVERPCVRNGNWIDNISLSKEHVEKEDGYEDNFTYENKSEVNEASESAFLTSNAPSHNGYSNGNPSVLSNRSLSAVYKDSGGFLHDSQLHNSSCSELASVNIASTESVPVMHGSDTDSDKDVDPETHADPCVPSLLERIEQKMRNKTLGNGWTHMGCENVN